ncbi:MAG: amino acid adenylation domain-containing protein, partial [Candidatus Marinamargulisbacteria bacterium]
MADKTRLSDLTPQQRQQLLRKTRRPPEGPELKAECPEGEMSSAQKRMWFLTQVAENGALHTITAAYRIRGDISVDILKQTFILLLDLHRIDRAVFIPRKGRIIRAISPHQLAFFNIVDLSDSAAFDLDIRSEIDRILGDPFDLEKGPLVRLFLFKRNPREYVICFHMHHIVSDGWSVGILIKDFMRLYGEIKSGHVSDENRSDVDYGSFVALEWERERSAKFQKSLDFWVERLAGRLAMTRLPFQKHPAQGGDLAAGRVVASFDSGLKKRMATFCHSQEITMFMLTQAVFKTMLFRYTGNEDIIVGAPVANRPTAQLEKVVGLFVNTITLRTFFSQEANGLDILKQVKQSTLESLNYMDTPFEKVVARINPHREKFQNPFFQILFVYQNEAIPNLSLPGLEVEQLDVPPCEVPFELVLEIWEKDEALECHWIYQKALYSDVFVQQMSIHFETLMEAFLTSPNLPVRKMLFLTPAATEAIRSKEALSAPKERRSISSLFSEVCLQSGARTAVVSKDGRVTYSELQTRVAGVHDRLIREGVKRGDTVGIMLAPSIGLSAAILGVLELGASYLPIEKKNGVIREGYKLEACGARCLITEDDAAIALFPKIQLISNMEKTCKKAGGGRSDVSPEDRAYTLFTSGTTGEPSRVDIAHKGIVNYALWKKESQKFGKSAVCMQLLRFSFDGFCANFFPTLLSGGTLVLDQFSAEKCESILASIKANGVNRLGVTPSIFDGLMQQDDRGILSCLNFLVLGGESLTASLVEKISQKYPKTQIINEYGPSENCIASTAYHVKRPFTENIVGTPIKNTMLCVLDRDLNPVPAGVGGDIYVSGVGLYLPSDWRSDPRYIESALGDQGALYKTGDIGHWNLSGLLVFDGRKDNEVKIRGTRVNANEVQAVLDRYPGLVQVMVTPEKNTLGRMALTAYFRAKKKLEKADLLAFLRPRVPIEFIPALFVQIEAFPITDRGKVDFEKLAHIRDEKKEVQKPSLTYSAAEKGLLEICQHSLGLRDVSAGDDFFRIGGNSFNVIHLSFQIKKVLNANVSLSQIYSNPIISDLARLIKDRQRASEKGPIFWPLHSGGGQQPIYFVVPPFESYFVYSHLSSVLGDDQPFFCIEISIDQLLSGNGLSVLGERIGSAMLKTKRADAPFRLGGWSLGGLIAIETARFLQTQKSVVERVTVLDPTHRVLKGKDDLIRAYLGEVNRAYAVNLQFRQGMGGAGKEALVTEIMTTMGDNNPGPRFHDLAYLYDITHIKNELVEEFIPTNYSFPIHHVEALEKGDICFSETKPISLYLRASEVSYDSVACDHYAIIKRPCVSD